MDDEYISAAPLGDLWTYDLKTEEWTQLHPKGRHSAAVPSFKPDWSMTDDVNVPDLTPDRACCGYAWGSTNWSCFCVSFVLQGITQC